MFTATKEEIREVLIKQHRLRTDRIVVVKPRQISVIGRMCRQEIDFHRKIVARKPDAKTLKECLVRIQSMQEILQSLASSKSVRVRS
jgi:hypothetical protein